MDPQTLEIHTKKLHELVFDEDQIVTILSLAIELNVSAEESKHILTSFVEEMRQAKPKQLSCTVILTGIRKDTGDKTVMLLKESDVKTKSEQLNEGVEVLFSVQKSSMVNYTIIASLDKEYSRGSKRKPISGLITSRNCRKRNIKVVATSVPSQATIPQKEQSSNSKSGIKSFFSNTQKPTTNGSQSSEKKGIKETKTKGGLSGFLSAKPAVKKETLNDDTKENTEVVVNSVNIPNVEVKDKVPESKPKEKPDKKRKSNKTSTTQPNKKRKRIIQHNDSDSDDIFESNISENEIVEQSEDEIKIASPPKPTLAPKNKRQKAVDRTYEDEEGFIVTKTEYILESASEDEVVNIVEEKEKAVVEKPKATKATKKSSTSENDSSPKGKKKKGKKGLPSNQASITSFFSKK